MCLLFAGEALRGMGLNPTEHEVTKLMTELDAEKTGNDKYGNSHSHITKW